MFLTLLLKYWKYVLGVAILSALGAIILVQHLELSSAQSSLAHCRAQSAILSSTIFAQNAAIRAAHAEQKILSRKVALAEHAAKHIELVTVTKIERIKAIPIGPSCKDAMSFLRKEALRFPK
jgi:hypothetical protein